LAGLGQKASSEAGSREKQSKLQTGGNPMRLVLTGKNLELVKAKLPEKEREKVKQDDYLTRIIKYIPSEVVALYITLYGIASAAKDEIPFNLMIWLIFVLGALGTVLYLWRVAKVDDGLQIAISTGAFVVWVFALGGPFSELSWYHPVYGALLLPIYTFFIPIVVSK